MRLHKTLSTAILAAAVAAVPAFAQTPGHTPDHPVEPGECSAWA